MGVEILAPLGSFTMICFIVYVIVRAGVTRSEHRLQAHSRMLDRFGNSAEFISFLQTPEGRNYLQIVSMGSKRLQKEKIIASVRLGVIIVVLSIGLIPISFLMGFHDPMRQPPFVFGFLGLFLGAGFLASAAVSWWLTKAWGVDESPGSVGR
ncbi:MAG TPA: hypothetical protein VMS56_01255 [Thermoanaerobaculia bacterium]|nr:hypothetical protein [Thermoanaerobaculia bacterium]